MSVFGSSQSFTALSLALSQMSGLDDELLGLVDDESGSEAPASEKAVSPSPPRSPGELSDNDDDKMGRKGTARPVPKRRRAPKYVDEGEEEGELYVFVPSIHSHSTDLLPTMFSRFHTAPGFPVTFALLGKIVIIC